MGHLEQAERMYESILRVPMPQRYSSVIRRGLATHYVSWGRVLASSGDLRGARERFRDGIRAYPRMRWAWTQYLQSVVAPRRLLRSLR
jgi:hypothetical protein